MSGRIVSAIAVTVAILPLLWARGGGQPAVPSPPMGWNSWDSYGLTVTESEFKQNAGYMGENLRQYGWEYAVVDEGWYLQNPEAKAGSFRFTMDPEGRYTPALNRFPGAASEAGFSKLAAWVHERKMKFGIHIIRGIPREAVRKNLPIAGSPYRAAEAANPADTCAWNSDNYGVKPTPAGQAYYNSIAALYARWGVDFVKIDCISSPYLGDEIRVFSEALHRTGRPIVLSLSPGPTPLDKANDVQKYAQMWRISGDFWDHWQHWPKQDWSQGLRGEFQLTAKWAPYAGAGHWPDADMLPLGYLGPRPGQGKARQSNFTHEEEKTVMTLWSICRSPLIMGGNLNQLDAWTKSLLTNDEVIAVNQHSSGGHAVLSAEQEAVWVAKGQAEGVAYVALFNLADIRQTVEYPLQSLGTRAVAFAVRDLWERKDFGKKDKLRAVLQPHAAALFRVSESK